MRSARYWPDRTDPPRVRPSAPSSFDKEFLMNRFLSITLITTAIVVLAACSTASSGQVTQPSIDPNAVRISANDLAFSTSTLTAPAGKPFQIAFDNQESAPHNVAIYRDASTA